MVEHLLCRLGHARLESFEVVQIADANHVEVSMAQQFLGKIRETLAAFQGYIFRSHLNKAPPRPEY